MAMRIWAFVSQKGGTGKSTLSTQLAVYATQLDEKVVLIDMDTQRSATEWHQARGAGKSPGVVLSLPEKLSAVVKGARDSGAFSLVIIDTAGQIDRAALEAVRAADLIICPTTPAGVDMKAFRNTVQLIQNADALSRAIGVVNKVPGQGGPASYAKASDQLEAFGIRVAGAYITQSSELEQATTEGWGVTERKTKTPTKAAKEIIALWGELNETWPAAALAGEVQA
jgi:chromosome partitioning protein